MNIINLIGEATAYDKKLQLEVKRPKSWLKSVSAFANGEGGTLVFGISDDDQVVGLADAESDAERISEEVKTKLDGLKDFTVKMIAGANVATIVFMLLVHGDFQMKMEQQWN